jgi:hypothetical protein
LLGSPSSRPADVLAVVREAKRVEDDRQGGGDGSESRFGDDMTESDGRGVWLLGEQRWERQKPGKEA